MDFRNTIFESDVITLLVFILVFFVNWIGVLLYRKIALKKGILANPNFRSLHEFPIPKGGGIVFSMVFVVSLFYHWWLNQSSNNLFLVLAVGGGAAALFGFLDDLKEIRAMKKFAVQLLLSGWALFWLDGGPLLFIDWIPSLVSIPVTILFLVWMMNGYNFMDGIDGMAVSGAVFVSGTVISVLLLTHPESEFIVIIALLLVCSSAFMLFNWPPASIFMGDAGSVFLGYLFGSFILITIMVGDVTIWTWLVVFGYFFADITMTQIIRIIVVKKWYLAHRSHAYQNLARITGSHLKITGGVVFYNVVWILPLTLWSALYPEMALYAVVLAISPGLVVAYRYGPLLSSS
jgi:Fuc2NAc and GlcNAc transferase